MHPADHMRGSKDDILKDKLIVLAVTGSIAAVSTVKLARELTRLGAKVVPVMTRAATKIIHPDSLGFACATPTITELTGNVEHVALCGEVPDHADLLLIAPCTANTIGKIAFGIDDTPVSTMATTALGTGIPILIVPAMHAAMYNNPLVMENLDKLKSVGITFVGPKMEEKKAKMADQEDIVTAVTQALGPNTLNGKRVLIIAGPTRESIDEMRVITNKSTGGTGVALAEEAYRLGAETELWLGGGREQPCGPSTLRFVSTEDLKGMVSGDQGGWDIIFLPAAIADYSPQKSEGKIPSGQPSLSLDMRPVDKILPLLRPKTKVLVGFKAESGITKEELASRARKRMSESGADMMIANLLEEVGEGETHVLLINEDGVKAAEGTKKNVSRRILEEVAELGGS